jgi:DNA-binding transcriptional ArsR family regulator
MTIDKNDVTGEEGGLGASGESLPDFDKIMRNAHRASHFLKALSHETRLLLLCLLAHNERSVTDLEHILSLRQASVSQQLARLRLDGLVSTRRDGKTIYYSIANEDIRRAIQLVYEVFCKEDPERLRGHSSWQDYNA